MKTSKDEDQVNNNNLLKIIHFLSYDVHDNTIDMDFLNKVEYIKQYRQTVMNSENVDSFKSVTQKFQKLKIMTRVVVHEKIRIFGMDDYMKTNSNVNCLY